MAGNLAQRCDGLLSDRLRLSRTSISATHKGIILNNQERVLEACEVWELQRMPNCDEDELWDALLVFANKQDLPNVMGVVEITPQITNMPAGYSGEY
jgi:hypothetical protein